MNSKAAEAILKKYWAGETSREEELALKAFFAAKGSAHKDAAYFNYLQKKASETSLGEAFDMEILNKLNQPALTPQPKISSIRYWLVAASLALIVSLGIIFKDQIFTTDAPPVLVQADTYDDPEKALEETKKALLFLSSKLNESGEYAGRFSKFEQSRETIEKN